METAGPRPRHVADVPVSAVVAEVPQAAARFPIEAVNPFRRVGSVCRSVTYTRPSATVGPLYPLPMAARQRMGIWGAENLSTMPVSFQTSSRVGPRHWGQSSPLSWRPHVARLITMPNRRIRNSFCSCIHCRRGQRKIKEPGRGRIVQEWRSLEAAENRIPERRIANPSHIALPMAD